MAEVVLGLDAGTSSAKALAVDRTGRILAIANSDPIATRSTSEGGSEQHPDEIWQALAAASRSAVEALGAGVRVAALSMAAQSGSVIPVPSGGRAGRAITWMDTRSRSVVESWPREVAERIRAVSGWSPASGAGLSTIAWLQAVSSDAGAGDAPGAVDRWASVDDYLLFRLTGQWVTNPSNASGMQLMEVSARRWSPELCQVAGIDADLLSRILESGTAAGSLTGGAAASLGLDAGIPVVVGGHDQACAALGLGVVGPGDLFLSAGTAWVLTVVTDRADVAALPSGLNLSPHVVPGRWTASQNLGGLGATLAGTPRTRMRAAFETCAGEVSRTLDDAGEYAGGDRELVMVGGGTRFEELVEMIADTIGRSVMRRPDASWPALGAARLAAAHLGWAAPEAERIGSDL
jgi:xylulokinase